MTNALAWVRKSKGSDDDIGLEEQREKVFDLAEEYDPDYEHLDLGIQSGFSTMSRDPDASTTWLDQNIRVEETIERLEDGEFDRLVAYDDRRVCRDDYLSVIEYAAQQGGCEFVYVGDIEEDDLGYDIHRRVERETKEEEIRKAEPAIQRRQEEEEDYQGSPPFGTQFDEDGPYLEKDDDEWEDLVTIFQGLDDGRSYRELEDETGVSIGRIFMINSRGREFYEQYGDLRPPAR